MWEPATFMMETSRSTRDDELRQEVGFSMAIADSQSVKVDQGYSEPAFAQAVRDLWACCQG
jgi:hypothetical protein